MDTNDINGIAQRLLEIRESLPDNVTLVAVSKTHPVEFIQAAYDAGQRIFGENKVQEMVAKHEVLPKDIEWHFIGHVQRNKIRQMASFVSTIQGIDSFAALEETNRQAERFGRTITCLLQIHIATEESKFGFFPQECSDMLAEGNWRTLSHVRIGGVMGMASNTDNGQQVLTEFRRLAAFFNSTKERFFGESNDFRTISAGMSGDYRTAIQAGSNMVRIGTGIFGIRDYTIQQTLSDNTSI